MASAAAGHRPDVAKRRRVLIADARDNGKHLRTTWHRDKGVFVVSIWSDDVCVGTVQVPLADAPQLIGLLVDGLAHAAGKPQATATGSAPPRGPALGRLRTWLRRGGRRGTPGASTTTTLATVRDLHG